MQLVPPYEVSPRQRAVASRLGRMGMLRPHCLPRHCTEPAHWPLAWHVKLPGVPT